MKRRNFFSALAVLPLPFLGKKATTPNEEVVMRYGDTKLVFINGRLLRKEFANGGFMWFNEDGRLHREGGPAYKNYGHTEHYLHGVLHNENGPAVEHKSDIGDSRRVWYRHGKVTRSEYF